MNDATLRELIMGVQSGTLSAEEMMTELRRLPYADLGFAKIDHHRELRQGLPEAIYGPGKTPEHCAAIVAEMLANGTGPVVLSRVDDDQAQAAMLANEGAIRAGHTLYWRQASRRAEQILVITAGTADLAVASEAVAVLEALGFKPRLIADCGVAGIHRLVDQLPALRSAQIVITVAGMEGALASVVGGLYGRSRHCSANKRRLRQFARRRNCTVGHDGKLRLGCNRGWYRQWLWCGVCSRSGGEPIHNASNGVTRVAYFNCFSGIAGDMALGALFDAGADLNYVRQVLGPLDVGGWTVEPQKINKLGLSATYANVKSQDDRDNPRNWHDIKALLAQTDLPVRVEQRAQLVFSALATAEADVHGVEVGDVHFHEVGAVDAIVDIVGTCAALESLRIDEVYCSAVVVGSGTIDMAHGTLPNPGPATLRLLQNAQIAGSSVPFELTTPTGAAIVAGLSSHFGAMPAIRVESSGYGAGRRDIASRPNCLQVVIGDADDAAGNEGLVALETNVDDVTGEVLAYAVSKLMEAGPKTRG